ncbi:MAG: type II toxin-antitoxin system RelE/ParE family toxin [Armatimonadetes bacterium]|nr:type II toxin-antitoxin system RelE/ParE family toxin [Armatimonadota bacterium]
MRVFLNKPFQRFARKESITAEALWDAVTRAERGLIDADLGGGVIKQRIPRPNEGRSGGYRSIVLYRTSELAFFVYGFPKSGRDNVSKQELIAFRDLAEILLNLSLDEVQRAVKSGALQELEEL